MRDRERDEQTEERGGVQPRRKRHLPGDSPEMAEILVYRLPVPAEKEPDDDQADQRERFGGGEEVLDELAIFQAAAVRPGEQQNHEQAQQLRRR